MHYRGLLGKWGFVSLVVLALLIGFSATAFAQQSTATLTGTVTDPKGLAMANAMVVVHSEDTGTDMKPVTTTDTGIYTVPLLPPGIYDVTASQSGFATVLHKGVTLQVGQTVRIDIEMPVAAQQSLVTVTTEAPILETEKTEQSQNVSENLVSTLPVGSRRWEQFALLTPGSNPDGTNGSVSFHGIAAMYNNNSVDGANNNTAYDQTTRGGYNAGYVYSPDAIREFQVASSGYSAELGQAAGAAVNAVTKSGTSQFHGDLFYDGRSPSFNAFDPVSKFNAALGGTTPSQPVKQQHQFGGSLGGPLVKDKLFFFVSADQFRRVDPMAFVPPVPINSLTCPQIGALEISTSQATMNSDCAAANNFINAHMEGNFPQELWQDVELVKLDYQLNQSNHVSVVTNVRDYQVPVPTTVWDFNSCGTCTANATTYIQDRFIIGTLSTVIGSNKVNEFRYQWGKDNNYGPINKVAAPAVSVGGLFEYGNNDGTGFQDEHRNQITDNFSVSKGSHSIKFGGDWNILDDSVRGSTSSLGPYTYSGVDFCQSWNSSGTKCNATVNNDLGCSASSTNLAYCNWIVDMFGVNVGDVFNTGANASGQHFTSFAQFHDNAFPNAPQTFAYDMPTQDVAGYIQDTWKARPNLTVNFGLRYDVQLFPKLPHSVALVCAAQPQNCVNGANTDLAILDHYTTFYPNEYDGIQPRVGIAWNFRKTTVLRIGGGEFFAKTDLHNLKNVFSGAGEATTACQPSSAGETVSNCAISANVVAGFPAGLTFPDSLFNQQDVPNGTLPLAGAVPSVAVFSSNAALPGNLLIPNSKFGIRGADPNLKRPRAWEFEGAIEQQLPGNMNLSVSYAFTRGIHLPRGIDENLASNYDANLCTTPFVAGTTQTCGVTVNKTYSVMDATDTTVLQTFTAPVFFQRLSPSIGPVHVNTSSVNTMYNGMIVTLRKPISHGFELLVNYTLSKATDNGAQGGNNGGEGQLGQDALNPLNPQAEEGASTTDARNRFTSSVVWQPNFGMKSSNKAVKELLGGWTWSGTVIAQNGTHYQGTISSSASPVINYCGAAAAGCNYSGFYAPGSASLLAAPVTLTGLNGGMTGALLSSPGTPTAGRIFWVPRDAYELPNLYNVDMRLEKNVVIKEHYNIAIRGEAFNLLNTTLVQAVSAKAYKYTSSNCNGLASACLVPFTGPVFGTPTTTTGNLLGPRQMQASIRFAF